MPLDGLVLTKKALAEHALLGPQLLVATARVG